MNIIATIVRPVQVGHETFIDRRTSMHFTGSATLAEIELWAKSHLGDDYRGINDVQFSDFSNPGSAQI